MKKIPLTQGAYTLVDDEDFDWLSQWKWRLHSKGYACRTGPRPERKEILMHRLILDAPAGVEVDHENRNRLDNKRSNLRLATTSQNHMNQVVRRGRFKGVHPAKKKGRWFAMIGVHGRSHRLGTFDTEEEAARAYDCEASKVFGEFAVLNYADIAIDGL